MSALDLIDAAIAELEAKLNLAPGESLPDKQKLIRPTNIQDEQKTGDKPLKVLQIATKVVETSSDQPEICKLEFKVGLITKVWVHPDADKLYCEEIDVGETEPRLIASGLRKHYSLEEMLGSRVIVVANLKPKKLVGFLSHGMVLCATIKVSDDEELVEFVEPPEEAKLGEIIFFQGLPSPEAWSAAQIEKKKIFQNCLDGMRTLDDGVGAWHGHAFMTSAGPCKARTIKGGEMR